MHESVSGYTTSLGVSPFGPAGLEQDNFRNISYIAENRLAACVVMSFSDSILGGTFVEERLCMAVFPAVIPKPAGYHSNQWSLVHLRCLISTRPSSTAMDSAAD